MIVFRLSKAQYKNDLSGRGAEIAGGRWNNKGIAVLYTSANRSLCMAEVLVHQTSGLLAKDFWIISIEVPDDALIPVIQIQDLPPEWDTFPHPSSLKIVGDAFIKENKYIGLSVPSVVVQGDRNILLNPRHPEFVNIKVIEMEPFEFDPRLLR